MASRRAKYAIQPPTGPQRHKVLYVPVKREGVPHFIVVRKMRPSHWDLSGATYVLTKTEAEERMEKTLASDRRYANEVLGRLGRIVEIPEYAVVECVEVPL